MESEDTKKIQGEKLMDYISRVNFIIYLQDLLQIIPQNPGNERIIQQFMHNYYAFTLPITLISGH